MPATAVAPTRAAGATVVRDCLQTVRRRLLAQRFLDWLGGCLLGGAGLLLAIGVGRFLSGVPPFSVPVSLGMCALALGSAIVGALTGATDLAGAAAQIDARAGTHDRFHTALAFSARAASSRSPLEELTLAECERFVARFPVRRWTPVRAPRAFLFLAVPLVSLALLAWHASLGIGQPPRDPGLDAAVAKRADALEKIAERLRPRDAKTPAQTDAGKLADELKKSADRLKQSAGAGDDQKLRTALKELSSLEAMLNAMKQAAHDEKISPGELAALAAALASDEKTRAAAESLKAGNLEKAAADLEKLLEQLKEQGNPAQALQQLAQAMQEQAAKLTEQEKNEVARQMEQAAQGAQSGQGQLSQQALQRLADLLRRAGQKGQTGTNGQAQASSQAGSGQPMTERQLQDLLNALENMKEGLQPGSGQDPSSKPGDGQGSSESLAVMESFSRNPSGDPKAGEVPSGVPGSEHDEGHPDKLFGSPPPDAPKFEGASRKLQGTLGDGESLQELTAAGAGPGKAGRRYRELYEAMAPAAQETVEQENIPLGSRGYIKRYFENIRPRD